MYDPFSGIEIHTKSLQRSIQKNFKIKVLITTAFHKRNNKTFHTF